MVCDFVFDSIWNLDLVWFVAAYKTEKQKKIKDRKNMRKQIGNRKTNYRTKNTHKPAEHTEHSPKTQTTRKLVDTRKQWGEKREKKSYACVFPFSCGLWHIVLDMDSVICIGCQLYPVYPSALFG